MTLSLAEQELATAAKQNGHTPGAEHAPLPLSDVSNAERLRARHGDDLLYCQPWKKWLTYTGTHWEIDNRNKALYFARDTAIHMAEAAAAALQRLETAPAAAPETSPQTLPRQDPATARAQALLKHARASLNIQRLQAMLQVVSPDRAVTPADFQTTPWLLNCTNGTVDLQTGTVRPHRRADWLMHCLPVPYDPGAPCPRWRQFLQEIFAGNADLVDFMQRAIGYSLTGIVHEQALFILHGDGSNGKSTLLNCVLMLLGDHLAAKAPSELLLTAHTDRHPTEKTLLFQRRLVCCIETQNGRRLDETFVREATGGDPITARRMREDFWTFQPTHKLWLATNHMPDIVGTDHAIWRRIKRIPFTVRFVGPGDEPCLGAQKKDPTLPATLQAEWPGILAWAVAGCQAWQRQGLQTPSVVIDATKEFQQRMDVLGHFIAECCYEGAEARVSRADLLAAYTTWCQQAGEERLKEREFGERLTARNYTRYTNNGTWYKGIGLQRTAEAHRKDWD